MKILLALLSVAGALTVMLWWGAAGASWFTLDKVLKTTVVKDDFGDMVTKEVWVDKFVPGLLDFAAPGFSVLMFVALVLLYLSRKQLFNYEQAAH